MKKFLILLLTLITFTAVPQTVLAGYSGRTNTAAILTAASAIANSRVYQANPYAYTYGYNSYNPYVATYPTYNCGCVTNYNGYSNYPYVQPYNYNYGYNYQNNYGYNNYPYTYSGYRTGYYYPQVYGTVMYPTYTMPYYYNSYNVKYNYSAPKTTTVIQQNNTTSALPTFNGFPDEGLKSPVNNDLAIPSFNGFPDEGLNSGMTFNGWGE